jgi:hypothetical protein
MGSRGLVAAVAPTFDKPTKAQPVSLYPEFVTLPITTTDPTWTKDDANGSSTSSSKAQTDQNLPHSRRFDRI